MAKGEDIFDTIDISELCQYSVITIVEIMVSFNRVDCFEIEPALAVGITEELEWTPWYNRMYLLPKRHEKIEI